MQQKLEEAWRLELELELALRGSKIWRVDSREPGYRNGDLHVGCENCDVRAGSQAWNLGSELGVELKLGLRAQQD